MAYRDEKEALRAHVGRLERELAVAHDKIARLRREGTSDGAAQQESSARDAPGVLVLERELDFDIDAKGYEAIANVVRSRLGVEVAQVGRGLTAPGDVFSLRREGGATLLRMRGDWQDLWKTKFFRSTGYRTVLVALPFIWLMAAWAASRGFNFFYVVLASLAVVVAGAAWLSRQSANRLIEQHVETHRGVFATVLALAEEHALRAPSAKVRVGDEEGQEEVPPATGVEAQRAR